MALRETTDCVPWSVAVGFRQREASSRAEHRGRCRRRSTESKAEPRPGLSHPDNYRCTNRSHQPPMHLGMEVFCVAKLTR